MWIYEKRLQYPVRVDTTNPTLAAMIIEQFEEQMVNCLQASGI